MRYIDADALYTKIPNDSPYKSSLRRLLLQAPTADVVPRAKYEEVYSALDIACKSLDDAVALIRKAEKEERGRFDDGKDDIERF